MKTKTGDEVVFISKNKDGNYYVGIKVKVQRGIRGKTTGKVDELLIIGLNKKYFDNWIKCNII